MARRKYTVRPGGLFPAETAMQTDFANALDFDVNAPAVVTPGDVVMHPGGVSGNTRPASPNPDYENPRPNAPYNPPDGIADQYPPPANFAAALGTAPTVPTANNNFGTNYSSVDTGLFMGPVRPAAYGGNSGTGSGTCRPRRTCAEKCAYNEQMKEQCKGCKSYFRRTKKYIYPKRKKTYRRRSTYRRKRSCGCGKSKITRAQKAFTSRAINRTQTRNALDAAAWREYKAYRGWK